MTDKIKRGEKYVTKNGCYIKGLDGKPIDNFFMMLQAEKENHVVRILKKTKYCWVVGLINIKTRRKISGKFNYQIGYL